MLTIVLLVVFVLLVSLGYASLCGAPWVPTWKRDINRLVDFIEVKKGERFYELGCGDGRVCFAVAKKHGADVVGVELSLLQFLVARLRAFCFKRRAQSKQVVEMRWGNALKADLSDADAVYVFLMPALYQTLVEKFERELRPGTQVVTYVWPLPGWEPVRVDECEGAPKLYLYQV